MPIDRAAVSGRRLAPARLVALVCAAQVFVQIGAFFWPALLPQMMGRWSLTNSEAGWITSAFYAAYMLAVPVLVTLTDRVDARRVYLFGVGCTVLAHLAFGLAAHGFWSALALRALAGMGWAGTYMTGLKLLADQVDGRLMSRAVTGHAASIGVSGAVSFVLGDSIASVFGWQAAFLFAGGAAAIAWLAVALAVPPRAPTQAEEKGGTPFDFRPVLANRSAMAYALAYCVHTLEMNALRGWGVAFLAWVAARTGAAEGILSPTVIVTTLALIGTAASVLGNEAAIRFGRRRLVAGAMLLSIVLALTLASVGAASYAAAVALLLAYGAVVWLDSSSLTAGTAGTADPARRGATLAVHSMLGYAGGFIGPLAVGWALDLSGGMSPLGWGIAFTLVAALMALALATFLYIRPRELVGDRAVTARWRSSGSRSSAR
ncbi:MFS transporter [Enhydrobacter sp.]|jgi:predicted MFS family arabinose efflux permease|uniref:MFS transporter n=1 Tax=Enhydrobacter sp. TaxID=1894999 RepID=UPI0026296C76|nr:MFS transporter [Enhydrobacter sp.]WIM09161.1 MAG: Nitrate/nitrite transporter [Enhydrobacter sp.]